MTTIINPIDHSQEDICKSADSPVNENYSTTDVEISKKDEDISEVRTLLHITNRTNVYMSDIHLNVEKYFDI